MQKLVTSEQIRKLESWWIKQISPQWSLTLMEKAGSSLSEIAKEYKEPYLIICGKGNNGGDGIVAARYLHASGKKVFLALTSDETLLSHDAKINLELIKSKVQYFKVEKEKDNNFVKMLSESNTVVDCILGTGITGKLSSLFEWLIKSVNASHKLVIACDIPTGVNPDNGNVCDVVLRAETTVTFGYQKIGLLIYPGRKYSGKIITVDIGLPDIETNLFLLDDDFLMRNFPLRDNASNKGTFGRTLLVCGSKKYPGAALLASKAASSIGSGLTVLASKPEVFNKIAAVTPEIINIEFNLKTILEESLQSSVIVIGPGLTTENDIKEIVEALILQVSVPIVLDADGINVLAGHKELIKKVKKEIILTPHPKEFSRLLEISLDEVLNNKIELVRSNAKELNCTIVLKGPATIIGTKDGNTYVSPFSNSALAKGGTGDVLAGFIGGLISQGLKPDLAACVGVYIHGKTAELITKDKTVFSLLPQDLVSYLPQAIKIFVC